MTVLAPEAFMRPLQQITSAAPEASALLRVDARDACILCILWILCILCIQIPGVYAALFDAIGRGRACGRARCVSQKT